jgi:hypothetical protein
LLFEALAVFSGAHFEDVEGVTARIDAFSAINIIDGMQSLVDKSLLRSIDTAAGGNRWFSMLETIRDYASERLNERQELIDEIRRRHAEYFAAWRATVPGTADPIEIDARELAQNRQCAKRGATGLERTTHFELPTSVVLHDARGWYRIVRSFRRSARCAVDEVRVGGTRARKIALQMASHAR